MFISIYVNIRRRHLHTLPDLRRLGEERSSALSMRPSLVRRICLWCWCIYHKCMRVDQVGSGMGLNHITHPNCNPKPKTPRHKPRRTYNPMSARNINRWH